MNFIEHGFHPTYQSIKAPHSPEVHFTEVSLFKMSQYVKQSDAEVSWMGFVSRDKPLLYTVEDVFLMPQEVSAASTDIDADSWFELEKELGMEKMQTVRFWGHSHVNMEINPSETDDVTMETLSMGTEWYIRAICNKKGSMKCSVFVYSENVAFHDCVWTQPEDKEKASRCQAIGEELDLLVRKKTYKTSPNNYSEGWDKWNPQSQKWDKKGKIEEKSEIKTQDKKKVDASLEKESLTDSEVEELIEGWFQNSEHLYSHYS